MALRMADRRLPPCAGASERAREFMVQSAAAEWAPADWSAAGVAALRAENSEAAAVGCAATVEELGTELVEGVVGGVAALWVLPRREAGPEVVLFFFGGAFVVGAPEDDLSMAARLADRLGRRVCCPRYRLAPEHPYPRM